MCSTTFLRSSVTTGGYVQRYVYAFADGTSFTVIYNSKGCKMPVLAVVSIAETGERDVLAFCVGDRENEQVCNDLLADLKARGVKAIDLWISDGNKEVVSSCLCGHSQFARSQTHHARFFDQAAGRRNFIQQLTNYPQF